MPIARELARLVAVAFGTPPPGVHTRNTPQFSLPCLPCPPSSAVAPPQQALPEPPPQTAADHAPDFSIRLSPFAASDGSTTQIASAAGLQPVAQPTSPASFQAPAKRARSVDPSPPGAPAPQPQPQQQQQFASKHRPPRPPPLWDSGSLVLDGGSGGSPPASVRSPRGGTSPSGRRPAKQLSKTMGRVCIECGTSSTTQVGGRGGEKARRASFRTLPVAGRPQLSWLPSAALRPLDRRGSRFYYRTESMAVTRARRPALSSPAPLPPSPPPCRRSGAPRACCATAAA
jgi:hypothetical protein